MAVRWISQLPASVDGEGAPQVIPRESLPFSKAMSGLGSAERLLTTKGMHRLSLILERLQDTDGGEDHGKA